TDRKRLETQNKRKFRRFILRNFYLIFTAVGSGLTMTSAPKIIEQPLVFSDFVYTSVYRTQGLIEAGSCINKAE
ncbi:MAG: hypothetical protein IKM27_03375, partial [Clostridia bacterium]|nr:hypothetical protein [Clostridia bacterium]